MKYQGIPEQLFDELAISNGSGEPYVGEARETETDAGKFKLIEVDFSKYENGGIGAMGYRYNESHGHHTFALWSRKPQGDVQSIGEPVPLLLVTAGFKNLSRRMNSSANPGDEYLKVSFPSNGIYVTHPLYPLVLIIQSLAKEIQEFISRQGPSISDM